MATLRFETRTSCESEIWGPTLQDAKEPRHKQTQTRCRRGCRIKRLQLQGMIDMTTISPRFLEPPSASFSAFNPNLDSLAWRFPLECDGECRFDWPSPTDGQPCAYIRFPFDECEVQRSGLDGLEYANFARTGTCSRDEPAMSSRDCSAYGIVPLAQISQ